MQKSKVTRTAQRAVSDVLNRILLCECGDDEEFIDTIKSIISDYMLETDPGTGLICSRYDFVQSCLKIGKPELINEKYVHTDGSED